MTAGTPLQADGLDVLHDHMQPVFEPGAISVVPVPITMGYADPPSPVAPAISPGDAPGCDETATRPLALAGSG